MVRHEVTCWLNPERRACKTCAFESEKTDEGYRERGCDHPEDYLYGNTVYDGTLFRPIGHKGSSRIRHACPGWSPAKEKVSGKEHEKEVSSEPTPAQGDR